MAVLLGGGAAPADIPAACASLGGFAERCHLFAVGLKDLALLHVLIAAGLLTQSGERVGVESEQGGRSEIRDQNSKTLGLGL